MSLFLGKTILRTSFLLKHTSQLALHIEVENVYQACKARFVQ